MNEPILIFTDGAAKGNPGRGGFGVVIAQGGMITEKGGFKEHTTNNEMELKAVVEALKEVAAKKRSVEIYTDSKYVVEGAKGWVFGWAKNGWKTKANTDVLNKALWQELMPLLGAVEIVWHKVPGHVGIIGNERADTIASDFAATGKFDLYHGSAKDYGFDILDTSYDETKAKERSDARKRQAQKAHSYISLLDGVVKVHQTWGECEARVKGKRATKFKKSLDATEERKIIEDYSR
jgi:ribonuclease HI